MVWLVAAALVAALILNVLLIRLTRKRLVIADEIKHIKESIDDIEETQDEILEAVKELAE